MFAELELKPCRWRGPSQWPGRHACSSTIVNPGPFGVMHHQCWQCLVVDHRDPGDVAPRIPGAGRVRHLIYHLAPLGPSWRWHLAELLPRLGLFNGARVMTVATGEGCADPGEVSALLAGHDVRVHHVRNDPQLREMTGYPLLLRELARYRGRGDAHLYAHAKGASSEVQFDGVREWSRTMLTVLLDYWPVVQRALVGHSVVGIYRRRIPLIGHPCCGWHYSGSWRWARNRDWFARPWDEHNYHWASTETQPGSLFGIAESACLFGEFEHGDTPLYHAAAWQGWAGRARDGWYAEHAADCRPGREWVGGCWAPGQQGEDSQMEGDFYRDALEAAEQPTLDQLYEADVRTPSDINEHLATLRGLAAECGHVTELGTHVGHSTTAFLHARPAVLVCYDLVRQPAVDVLARASQGTFFQFWEKDCLKVEIADTDLLFIDTLHDYDQLTEELRLHAPHVRKYIVLHDTTTFGEQGETAGRAGLWPAVEQFVGQGTFRVKARWEHNNGLTVLERVGPEGQAG